MSKGEHLQQTHREQGNAAFTKGEYMLAVEWCALLRHIRIRGIPKFAPPGPQKHLKERQQRLHHTPSLWWW